MTRIFDATISHRDLKEKREKSKERNEGEWKGNKEKRDREEGRGEKVGEEGEWMKS